MNCNLTLIGLSCYVSSEVTGDEIYISLNNKKIWPINGKFIGFKSNSGHQVCVEISDIQVNRVISLELWDHDLFFDDKLGTFEFLIDGTSGIYVTDLTRRKENSIYKYSLTWGLKIDQKKTPVREFKSKIQLTP